VHRGTIRAILSAGGRGSLDAEVREIRLRDLRVSARRRAMRLPASLAILHAADALAVEDIGPISAEGVKAKSDHKRFIASLGG
jgi:hypothetical protein